MRRPPRTPRRAAILKSGRRISEGPGKFLEEPRAFYMLARIRARSPCLYARNTRRCPVLCGGACMGAGEDSYRLYSCGRCAQQVHICRNCDRGNQYCAGDCARLRRRESLQRAGQRYQQRYRGACQHAARQRVWRARHAQKVTHQGSLGSAVALIVAPTSIMTQGSHAESLSVASPPHGRAQRASAARVQARGPVHRGARTARCCFCGCWLGCFARLGALRAGS
jgi:hypothetical protein